MLCVSCVALCAGCSFLTLLDLARLCSIYKVRACTGQINTPGHMKAMTSFKTRLVFPETQSIGSSLMWQLIPNLLDSRTITKQRSVADLPPFMATTSKYREKSRQLHALAHNQHFYLWADTLLLQYQDFWKWTRVSEPNIHQWMIVVLFCDMSQTCTITKYHPDHEQ